MRSLGCALLLLTSCAVAARPVEGGDDEVDDPPLPEGDVTIVASAAGGPMANARLIAHAADGTTIDAATTDAAGMAQIAAAPFISLVTPFSDETSSKQVMTLQGARPGETVRFSTTAYRPQIETTFRITAPLDPEAKSYRVDSTCGPGGVVPAPGGDARITGSLDVMVTLGNCSRPADLAIVSLDAANQPMKAVWRMGAAISPNAVVAFGGPYEPVARATIDYSHVPASFRALATERGIVTARGMLAWEGRDVFATAGSARVALALPPVPQTTEVITTHATPATAAITRHAIVTWGPIAATRAIDLATLLADFATAPTYDGTTVAWTETAGARADFVITTLYSTDRRTAGWTWRLAVPRGEDPRIALPDLPAELAAFTPGADSQVVELTSVASQIELGPIVLALDEPSTFNATQGELVRRSLVFASDE